MISIDVVGCPIGMYIGTGVLQSAWVCPPLETIHPVLLYPGPPPGVDRHVALNLGVLYQGLDTFGALRDKEVRHFNVSGDLVLQSHTPVCSTPFRKLMYWGEEYRDSFTLHYSTDRLIEGVVSHWEREALVSFEFLFVGDVVLCIEERTIISQSVNGMPFMPEQVGTIWTAISFNKRPPLYSPTVTYPAMYFDRIVSEAERLELAASVADNLFVPIGRSDLISVGTAPLAYTVDEMISIISRSVSALRWDGRLIDREPVDFGELTVECADQLDFVDSNVLSLVFDINDWRNLHTLWKNVSNASGWAKVLAVLRTIRSGRTNSLVWRDLVALFKPGASLYLFEKYGIETMLSDLDHIRKGLVKFINQPLMTRIHSRREVALPVSFEKYRTYTAVMTVEVDSYPNGIVGKIQQTIGNLKRFGVYPAMSNLWDIIPYSFVVDWFIDFGGFVKNCDTWLDTRNYFPIHHCIMSSKWVAGYSSTSLVPGDIPVSGDVEVSFYNRWITLEAPLPPVSLPDKGSGLVSHWAESLALIVQRVR